MSLLPQHIAALKNAAAKDPATTLLDLGMLGALEELAEQLAELSMEVVRHAVEDHDPRRRT
jgi:hypothetical protein